MVLPLAAGFQWPEDQQKLEIHSTIGPLSENLCQDYDVLTHVLLETGITVTVKFPDLCVSIPWTKENQDDICIQPIVVIKPVRLGPWTKQKLPLTCGKDSALQGLQQGDRVSD